jgi:hypothetical protein
MRNSFLGIRTKYDSRAAGVNPAAPLLTGGESAATNGAAGA